MKKGTVFTAYYYASVFKPALNAWRSEKVTARFEAVSDKMAVVVSADVDKASSKRQQFNNHGIEAREIGKKKRISSLYDVKEEA